MITGMARHYYYRTNTILLPFLICFPLGDVQTFTALSSGTVSSAFCRRIMHARNNELILVLPSTTATSCQSPFDSQRFRSKACYMVRDETSTTVHADKNNASIDFMKSFTADPIEFIARYTTNVAPRNFMKFFTEDPIEEVACYMAKKISSLEMFQQHHNSDNNERSITTTDDMPYYKDLGIGSMDSEELSAQIKTLARVGLPALLLSAIGCATYPSFAMAVAVLLENDQGTFAVLSQDASQYVQNILTTRLVYHCIDKAYCFAAPFSCVCCALNPDFLNAEFSVTPSIILSSGLMFSILVGYTYYFLYQQQERVFYSLFKEVSEAKSLLEQVALVCAGRSMYPKVLAYMSSYVCDDLKKMSTADPVECLSLKPSDDPLEGILYLTSVGEPGVVYDTIKSLRQARASRLGALQKKLPDIHIYLLRTLGAIVLVTFPVCGSGSQVIGGQGILEVQAVFFGVMIFGLAIVLGVITELWSPRGGAYNVDGVLSIMVRGLEEELRARMTGELGGPYGVTPVSVNSSFLLVGECAATADEAQSSYSPNEGALVVESKKAPAAQKKIWLWKLFHRAPYISKFFQKRETNRD